MAFCIPKVEIFTLHDWRWPLKRERESEQLQGRVKQCSYSMLQL